MTAIAGDPELLNSYTTVALRRVTWLGDDIGTLSGAFTAYNSLAPPGRTVPGAALPAVAVALGEFREVCRVPQWMAELLVHLDANGNGALDDQEIATPYLDGDDVLAVWLAIRGQNPDADPATLLAELDWIRESGGDLVTVARDEPGRTRVVVLNINDPDLVSSWGEHPVALGGLLEGMGIVEAPGPVHFVVHGFQDQATDDAEATGSLYDNYGVEDATVVAVNWPAGNEVRDWDSAVDNTVPAAEGFTMVLDTMYRLDPDTEARITCHSLGSNMTLLALTDMTVPDGVEPNINLALIQPAVTEDVATDPEYAAIVDTEVVGQLTITLNPDDRALGSYNFKEWFLGSGEQALGEQSLDDDDVQEIVTARTRNAGEGDTTTLIQHSDPTGGALDRGHLGLDPYGEYSEGELVGGIYLTQILGEELHPAVWDHVDEYEHTP